MNYGVTKMSLTVTEREINPCPANLKFKLASQKIYSLGVREIHFFVIVINYCTVFLWVHYFRLSGLIDIQFWSYLSLQKIIARYVHFSVNFSHNCHRLSKTVWTAKNGLWRNLSVIHFLDLLHSVVDRWNN